ncbi:MarR family winged helix-turn-helix transcriptional regulator [Gordonia phthalatica]|uniref:MarR family transcriptional regulator n=1 Tax=Gordonia phthalatica TaxID=1136941 RepID=A0A0N9N6J3_9ACTN|nr:MarR family transcriptional regulator [Gordonia phthalatica]ALG86561.1 MarR family transcriptional regulator [Gordonia phthalatica]
MNVVEPDSIPEPHWLTGDELATWQALHVMMSTLPAALTAQLQRDAELSFLEYYVLAALSEQPDYAMRMSRLALLASSELSRLSHLIRRLEKRGLVRRDPDPTDGRYTMAVLTADGLQTVGAAAPGHVAEVRRLVFDGLTDDERDALRSACTKMIQRLAPDCDH